MKERKKRLMIFLIIFLSSFYQCAESSSDSEPDSQNFQIVSDQDLSSPCEPFCPLSVSAQWGMKKVLILVPPGDLRADKKAQNAVKKAGGRITASIPGTGFIAFIPEDKKAQLSLLPELRYLISEWVDENTLSGLSSLQKKILERWNQKLTKSMETIPDQEPEPPLNDALIRPPSSGKIEKITPAQLPENFASEDPVSPEIAPAPITTMAGTVAVSVFFPESNGGSDPNQENWDSTRVDNVRAQIFYGLEWWANLAPVEQNLNFVITYFNPFTDNCMKTKYEPILHSVDEEGLWINEIMTCLGYTSGDYFDKVDSYNAWLASNLGASQAYSVFVVDDLKDKDNAFAGYNGRYFAYAYLGGPFEVMTYENDGYTIVNMPAVHAHETGHIFNAYDEYYGSCTCDDTQNECPNSNCDSNCLLDECCIMRGGVAPYNKGCLCGCTRGHIGWGCYNCTEPDCYYLLTSPKGGERWKRGSVHEIQWLAEGSECSDGVILKYKYKDQKKWKTIAFAPNTGTFSWTLPTRTGQVKVKVLDYDNYKFAGDSGKYFIIK